MAKFISQSESGERPIALNSGMSEPPGSYGLYFRKKRVPREGLEQHGTASLNSINQCKTQVVCNPRHQYQQQLKHTHIHTHTRTHTHTHHPHPHTRTHEHRILMQPTVHCPSSTRKYTSLFRCVQAVAAISGCGMRGGWV